MALPPFDLPRERVLHTEAPCFLRRLDPVMDERAFSAHCAAGLGAPIEREGPDTVAAFWAVPMLGTGGIVPPPVGCSDAT